MFFTRKYQPYVPHVFLAVPVQVIHPIRYAVPALPLKCQRPRKERHYEHVLLFVYGDQIGAQQLILLVFHDYYTGFAGTGLLVGIPYPDALPVQNSPCLCDFGLVHTEVSQRIRLFVFAKADTGILPVKQQGTPACIYAVQFRCRAK